MHRKLPRYFSLLLLLLLLFAFPIAAEETAPPESTDVTEQTTQPDETTQPEETTEPNETTEPASQPIPEETEAPSEEGPVTSGVFGFSDAFRWEVSGGVLTVSGSGYLTGWPGSVPPWQHLVHEIHTIQFSGSISGIQPGTFQGCASLVQVTLPPGMVNLAPNVFAGCGALQTVYLPEGFLELSAGVFSGCVSLNQINLPGSLHTIGAGCFSGCVSLGSIRLPNLSVLGERAFSGSGLYSVTVPASISSLPAGIFQNCSGLTAVTFQGGIASIGPRAFEGCSSLSAIAFSYGPEFIGDCAFSHCASLLSVYCPGPMPRFGENIFLNSPNAVLYYNPADTSWTPERIAQAAEQGIPVCPLGGTESTEATDTSDVPAESSEAVTMPANPGYVPPAASESTGIQTEPSAPQESLSSASDTAADTTSTTLSTAPPVPQENGPDTDSLLLWLIFLALMLIFFALVFLITQLRSGKSRTS